MNKKYLLVLGFVLGLPAGATLALMAVDYERPESVRVVQWENTVTGQVCKTSVVGSGDNEMGIGMGCE